MRSLFNRIDSLYPTLAYDFINELIKVQNKNINLNEMILRSEKTATSDGESYHHKS